MRIGLVGCGGVGEKRLRAIQQTGLGEIALLCDTDGGRAARLAETFGAKAAIEPGAIFADNTIGVVIVATPNSFLAEYALGALESGKSVLVEKPGAISSQQIASLIAATSERGPYCKVGYNHRFHPAALRIQEELESGAWGELLWVRAAYGHGGRPGYEREWRFQRELSGGGELIDQGVHLLDLVRWWADEPLSLLASHRFNAFYRSDLEDNAFLSLRAPSGCFVQLHCSATQWKNLFRVEIATENGLLVWEGLGSPNYGEERLTLHRRNPEGGAPRTESETFGTDDSWAAEWRHFYDFLVGEAKWLYSGIDESEWIFGILEQSDGRTYHRPT